MKKRLLRPRLALLALSLTLAGALPAVAAPRDAVAVLNRCGHPLKGDDTILENTVTGGHRTLKYERGTLNFNRVANDGWTFVNGTHRKAANLDAEAMEKFMPCLRDALADSAAPEPIQPITPLTRVEVSAKRDFKQLIAYTLAFLVALGLFLYWLSKRPKDDEGIVG